MTINIAAQSNEETIYMSPKGLDLNTVEGVYDISNDADFQRTLQRYSPSFLSDSSNYTCEIQFVNDKYVEFKIYQDSLFIGSDKFKYRVKKNYIKLKAKTNNSFFRLLYSGNNRVKHKIYLLKNGGLKILQIEIGTMFITVIPIWAGFLHKAEIEINPADNK